MSWTRTINDNEFLPFDSLRVLSYKDSLGLLCEGEHTRGGVEQDPETEGFLKYISALFLFFCWSQI